MNIANRNPAPEAALQYLTWALEEIEKFDNWKAAHHTRIALDELRGTLQAAGTTGERLI